VVPSLGNDLRQLVQNSVKPNVFPSIHIWFENQVVGYAKSLLIILTFFLHHLDIIKLWSFVLIVDYTSEVGEIIVGIAALMFVGGTKIRN
jgi:hypothetical protein